jgi:hypothetical protein
LLCNMREKPMWHSQVQPAGACCSFSFAFLTHQVQAMGPKLWHWSRDCQTNSSHVLLCSTTNRGRLALEGRVRTVFTVHNKFPGTEKQVFTDINAQTQHEIISRKMQNSVFSLGMELK